jgi:hypothetical protein
MAFSNRLSCGPGERVVWVAAGCGGHHYDVIMTPTVGHAWSGVRHSAPLAIPTKPPPLFEQTIQDLELPHEVPGDRRKYDDIR